MKILLSCLLGIMISFSLGGCKSSGEESSQSSTAQTTEATTGETDAVSETVSTPPPPLTKADIEKNLLEKEIADDNGRILIDASVELPVLTNTPYDAADAINAYFKTLSDEWFSKLATETKTEILESLPLESENFSVWTMDLSFEVTYNANGVLSILQLEYVNSGGAHPSSFRHSHTFDLKTGELLEITDILNGGPEEITALVTDGFLAQIKENPENYYQDAEKIITDGESYDGFYLTGQAAVFYYQMYDIAPYAMGYPQFSLPYTEADAFKIRL